MNNNEVSISQITQFGDHFSLRVSISPDIKNDLKNFNGRWSQYNPRKPFINRYGLCVLNERGSIGPGPALDSISEYNKENGTTWGESDFIKPTELYYSSNALKNALSDILPWICRTHFIKLGPGGFFPPHRDHTRGIQNTFRLIFPIENCNPPYCRFMLENTTLFWEPFRMYFVNTTKSHTLFNACATKDSIWLIVNARVCKESLKFVEDHMGNT